MISLLHCWLWYNLHSLGVWTWSAAMKQGTMVPSATRHHVSYRLTRHVAIAKTYSILDALESALPYFWLLWLHHASIVPLASRVGLHWCPRMPPCFATGQRNPATRMDVRSSRLCKNRVNKGGMCRMLMLYATYSTVPLESKTYQLSQYPHAIQNADSPLTMCMMPGCCSWDGSLIKPTQWINQ